MTNSTLEKVARAIYECGEQDSDSDNGSWDQIPDEPHAFCFALARAALQSLRQVDDETVEAMEDAAIDAACHQHKLTYAEIFTAAIDHILSQTPNQGSER